MRITLTATTKIVSLHTPTGEVQARVWEGRTADGVPVHAYITRIAVAEGLDPTAYSQFERELLECAKPSPGVAALPSVLVFSN